MKECEYCSLPVSLRSNRVVRFCSVVCANKSRAKRVPRPCAHCDSEFLPPRNHNRQKFCSTRCRDKARLTAPIVACSTCGTALKRQASRVAKLAHSFCSTPCMATHRRQHTLRGEAHPQHTLYVELQCDSCGEALKKIPSKVRRRNFCGVNCRLTWQRTSGYSTGPNSGVWRGGHENYRGPNWDEQRRLALERDHATCQGCGLTKRLQVHHIQPWVTFEHYALANQIENLLTLCVRCHKREEWAYWRAHSEMIHLYPETRRIHTCRKCSTEYLTKSHRSLDCDGCATGRRASRGALSAQGGHTPLPAPHRSNRSEVSAA